MISPDPNALPLVSVVIPCYNAEKFIHQAVASVLKQTYPNIEILVVDDGSTDSSLSILQSLSQNIRILIHPGYINKGVSFTRKLGIQESLGELIAFLDADDYWEPTKISYQVEQLRLNPQAVLCHTRAKVFYDDGLTEADLRNEFANGHGLLLYNLLKLPDFLSINRICNSSVLVRRTLVADVSFDAIQLFQFEDWLLWILLAYKGPFLFLPEPLTCYRYHINSATAKTKKNELIHIYSNLEFILTLISRVEGKDISHQLVNNLQNTLFDLLGKYNKNSSNEEKNRLVSLLLGRNEGELGYITAERNSYKSRLEDLQVENQHTKQHLSVYQDSRLHQFIEKICFWR